MKIPNVSKVWNKENIYHYKFIEYSFRGIAIAFIFIAILAIYSLQHSYYSVKLQLSSKIWTRTIYTEKYQIVHYIDINAIYVPSTAYNVHTYSKYIQDTCSRTKYHEVTTYDKKGHSHTSEESYTVYYDCSYYRTDADYDNNEWRRDIDLITTGDSHIEPYWSIFTNQPDNILGNIRESQRLEVYLSQFKRLDNGNLLNYNTTQDVWNTFDGDYSVMINRLEQVDWSTLNK